MRQVTLRKTVPMRIAMTTLCAINTAMMFLFRHCSFMLLRKSTKNCCVQGVWSRGRKRGRFCPIDRSTFGAGAWSCFSVVAEMTSRKWSAGFSC